MKRIFTLIGVVALATTLSAQSRSFEDFKAQQRLTNKQSLMLSAKSKTNAMPSLCKIVGHIGTRNQQ